MQTEKTPLAVFGKFLGAVIVLAGLLGAANDEGTPPPAMPNGGRPRGAPRPRETAIAAGPVLLGAANDEGTPPPAVPSGGRPRRAPRLRETAVDTGPVLLGAATADEEKGRGIVAAPFLRSFRAREPASAVAATRALS